MCYKPVVERGGGVASLSTSVLPQCCKSAIGTPPAALQGADVAKPGVGANVFLFCYFSTKLLLEGRLSFNSTKFLLQSLQRVSSDVWCSSKV
jgi:hypothetical protein